MLMSPRADWREGPVPAIHLGGIIYPWPSRVLAGSQLPYAPETTASVTSPMVRCHMLDASRWYSLQPRRQDGLDLKCPWVPKRMPRYYHWQALSSKCAGPCRAFNLIGAGIREQEILIRHHELNTSHSPSQMLAPDELGRAESFMQNRIPAQPYY